MNDKPELKTASYSLYLEQLNMITQESKDRKLFNESATLRQILDEWKTMREAQSAVPAAQ